MLKTNHAGMGRGGNCICPKCGKKILHQQGIPCQQEKCPNCGTKMMREGSSDHQLFEKKKNKKA